MRYRTSSPALRLPGRRRPLPPVGSCPNCGTPVEDRYCPHCGQRNADRLVSTRRIVAEALEDQLSLDGKLPRTLLGLLFRPGFLTREYVEGRIARYVPPFRLYLASSLLFFLVASVVADFDLVWRAMRPFVEQAERPAPPGAEEPRSEYVAVRLGIDPAAVPAWLRPAARYYVAQEEKINALPPREGMRVLYEATWSNVPAVVFLVVPLFALFLKGLYRRRVYVEHFVFVLHFHSLVFLLATVALAVRAVWLAQLLGIWILVYLFAAMWRAYRESLLRTAAKYLVLLTGYYLVLALIIGVVLVAAVLTV